MILLFYKFMKQNQKHSIRLKQNRPVPEPARLPIYVCLHHLKSVNIYLYGQSSESPQSDKTPVITAKHITNSQRFGEAPFAVGTLTGPGRPPTISLTNPQPKESPRISKWSVQFRKWLSTDTASCFRPETAANWMFGARLIF